MTIRRRFVVLLALRWFQTGLKVPVLILLLRGRGLDFTDVGVVVAVYGLTTAVFELPTGGLADVLGRRQVLLAATVVLAAESVTFPRSAGTSRYSPWLRCSAGLVAPWTRARSKPGSSTRFAAPLPMRISGGTSAGEVGRGCRDRSRCSRRRWSGRHRSVRHPGRHGPRSVRSVPRQCRNLPGHGSRHRRLGSRPAGAVSAVIGRSRGDRAGHDLDRPPVGSPPQRGAPRHNPDGDLGRRDVDR